MTSSLLVTHCNIFDLLNRPQQLPRSHQATFCDVMNQRGGAISWSAKDTRITKQEIDQVNSVGKRLCGWGKK